MHRPEALCFGAFWRLGRAQAEGECRLKGLNRTGGCRFGIRLFGVDRKPGPWVRTSATRRLAGAEGGPAGRPEDGIAALASIDAAAYATLANIIAPPIASPLKDDALSQENVVAYCERMHATTVRLRP